MTTSAPSALFLFLTLFALGFGDVCDRAVVYITNGGWTTVMDRESKEYPRPNGGTACFATRWSPRFAFRSLATDLDGDGDVDLADFAIVQTSAGVCCE